MAFLGMKYFNVECKFLVTYNFFLKELSLYLWQYEEMIFFMWINTHNEIHHKFLVLMICNTCLFWKNVFFPSFWLQFLGLEKFWPCWLSRISKKNILAHILCFYDIWYQKNFWPPQFEDIPKKPTCTSYP